MNGFAIQHQFRYESARGTGATTMTNENQERFFYQAMAIATETPTTTSSSLQVEVEVEVEAIALCVHLKRITDGWLTGSLFTDLMVNRVKELASFIYFCFLHSMRVFNSIRRTLCIPSSTQHVEPFRWRQRHTTTITIIHKQFDGR